jgi:tetratricopeptide (TPR) repeat protein
MSSCPSDLELRLLAEDGLESTAFESIDRHTKECRACRARLESFAWEIPAPSAGDRSDLPAAGDFPSIPGFAIQKQLGRGAMGVVYLAWQESVGRRVALKVIPALPGADRRARKRWRNEAKAVSSVRHPNAIALYDVGEADSWLYLVLEYIPGQSLNDRLLGPMRPRDAARLIAAVADGVHHIHQAGLLHLDLKPSNILLDGDPQAALDKLTPKVADFGLAVFDSNRDSSATTMAGPRGTPSYMAPEQATMTRASLAAAADVHALGAVLYESLTGRPPFQGTSPLETLEQVRSQEPVPPRRLNPKIPRGLDTIALKCLEKHPSRRYASAEALADDLHRWLDGKPVAARPVSPIEHAWRWCRRRPAVAALAAALMMTFSVGLVAVLLLWRHAEVEWTRAEQNWTHAERERSQAEAGYKAARDALAEICNLADIGLHTKVIPRKELVVRLQFARGRILGLVESRSNDLALLKLLATVDLLIARDFSLQEKLAEARPLLTESLLYCERILQEDPLDRSARQLGCQSSNELATIAERQGNVEVAIGHWYRAVRFCETTLSTEQVWELETLAVCRLKLAGLLERLGDLHRSRTILEANFRMLDNIPAKIVTPPLRTQMVRTQYELMKRELGPGEIDDLTAEGWEQRVTKFLSSMPSTGTNDPRAESELGNSVAEMLYATAGSQRRAGKLDEARRTTDRLHALAKLTVSRHEDQAAAHLSLRAALMQRAKDAWAIDDRAAVARNWKLALEEARQAQRLDPDDARAARAVSELQHRLHDLQSPPTQAESHGRPAMPAEKTGS